MGSEPPKENEFQGENTFEQLGQRIGSQLTTHLELRAQAIQVKMEAQVDGIEKQLLAKLDGKPGYNALIIHTLTIVGLIVTIIIGFLAFGGAQFNGGMSATGALAAQLVERERRDAEIDRKLEEIARRTETRQIKAPKPEPDNAKE